MPELNLKMLNAKNVTTNTILKKNAHLNVITKKKPLKANLFKMMNVKLVQPTKNGMVQNVLLALQTRPFMLKEINVNAKLLSKMPPNVVIQMNVKTLITLLANVIKHALETKY